MLQNTNEVVLRDLSVGRNNLMISLSLVVFIPVIGIRATHSSDMKLDIVLYEFACYRSSFALGMAPPGPAQFPGAPPGVGLTGEVSLLLLSGGDDTSFRFRTAPTGVNTPTRSRCSSASKWAWSWSATTACECIRTDFC